MIGMAIAILTTLSLIPSGGSSYLMIFAGLAIGGGIGAYIANKNPHDGDARNLWQLFIPSSD